MRAPRFLVTGGSAGIGRAVSDTIVSSGGEVVVLARRPPGAWEPPPSEGLRAAYKWIEADLERPALAARIVQEWLVADQGPLDGIVHCAIDYGSSRRHPILETTAQEYERMLAVNLTAQFYLTVALLPELLVRPRALVLAISSDVARSPGAGRICYAMTKAGSFALFSGLAEEQRNARISVVQAIPTRQVATPGLRRRRPPGYDFDGYATPEQIAQCLAPVLAVLGKGFEGACLGVPDAI